MFFIVFTIFNLSLILLYIAKGQQTECVGGLLPCVLQEVGSRQRMCLDSFLAAMP